MYKTVPDEDRKEVSLRIMNYYRNMVERAVARQHPDWSESQRKFAVFERIYGDDFSTEEMVRIKSSFVACHGGHS